MGVVMHEANWWAGWGFVLAGFVTGALLGLGFHREAFWGGYGSFRRRLARLGHVALVALGMLNVVYAGSAWPAGEIGRWAGGCFIAGGLLMPSVCFLTAWKTRARWLFPLPVAVLLAAVVLTLIGPAMAQRDKDSIERAGSLIEREAPDAQGTTRPPTTQAPYERGNQ